MQSVGLKGLFDPLFEEIGRKTHVLRMKFRRGRYQKHLRDTEAALKREQANKLWFENAIADLTSQINGGTPVKPLRRRMTNINSMKVRQPQ